MRLIPLVLGVAAAFVCVPSARAQPDRYADTETGWAYYFGASPTTIAGSIGQGLRPFSVERVGFNQYDTILVGNSGIYSAGTPRIAYDLTPTGVSDWLTANNLRLLDLECYDIGAGLLRMTAVGVPNSGGTSAPGWGYLYNATAAQINSWMSANGQRLIDLDVYSLNGTKYYSGVSVPNAGAAHHDWLYAYNRTEQEVVDLLTQNSARLVSISVESVGTITNPVVRYTVVAIGDNPGAGWFYGNLSGGQVGSELARTGSRLTCFRRFTDAFGQTRYAVAMVDNANAQTRRVRDLIWAGCTGTTGFQIKEVGGGVVAGVNGDFVWEPASTIKLLHGVYAIYQCALGNDSLTASVSYRNECATCPLAWTCALTLDSVSNSLRRMLEPSDNYALIAFEHRYGVPTLNNFAASIGSPNIKSLRQDCNCGQTLNTATCTDIVNLMEKAADGSLFDSGWRDTLFDRMNDLDGQGYGIYPTLSGVIASEAAAINLPASERESFRTAMRYANKGGLYDCSGPPRRLWHTEGGWASIPRKVYFLNNWVVVPREYTFALFDDAASTESNTIYMMKEEMFREQIREALGTWKSACTPRVTADPEDVLAAAGGSAEFTVEATGSALTYRWRRNNVYLSNQAGHIAGATAATLQLSNIVPADAGDYSCVVSGPCGSDTSAAAALTVIVPVCYPDCNGDGALNLSDFGCFQTKFALGQPYADCNGDGQRNLADFGCFQTKYALGCP
ncbi:MAG: immunoglobulin domain-containing protein [Phycisphaerales bacterium]|nr:immunoglobulin domain-containing protein [Phycisphaerales bacterium]